MSIQLSTRVMHIKDQTTGSYDTVDILKGSGIDDVQVNGTSVVTDGVAEINTNGTYGTATRSSPYQNTIIINPAQSSDIKAANQGYKPIVSSRQHEATFYGLARASGDTTQSSSSNPVGTYTDEAKVKIQKMLGIYEPPWELLNDITLDSESGIDLTADSNGTPYNLLRVFIYVFYNANLQTATVGYARYRFYSGDRYANSETGKYSTSTSPKYKYVFFDRKSNLTMLNYTLQQTTGSAGNWTIKTAGTSVNEDLIDNSNGGVQIGLGNIDRICLASSDVEPAGTRIRIYGQRAY